LVPFHGTTGPTVAGPGQISSIPGTGTGSGCVGSTVESGTPPAMPLLGKLQVFPLNGRRPVAVLWQDSTCMP
jgi:hypothetical protein